MIALGVAVAVLTALSAHHLWLYICAGIVWALAVRLQRRSLDKRLLLIIALAMRIPNWLSAQAHSDDLHRYFWDGHVQRAGINPYLYTPNAPEVEALRDENWNHVNNAHLPTIYPPLAQLLFRLAPNAIVWKAIVAIADLALLLLMMAKWPER